MITISLCMIVKDEEKVLERCLNPLKNLVDEIIIVDTGSSDNTKKIASKFTNKIYDYKWKNDFADARNFAFSKATMEYIYSADADEIIDEENIERFKILKQTLLSEIEIVQFKYCNQLFYGSVYNYDVEYRPKLYKRQRQFVWTDAVHEMVVLEPIVYDSEIEIIHMPLGSHTKRDLEIFEQIINNGVRLSKRLHNMYAKELFIAGKDEDFKNAKKCFVATLEDTICSIDEIKEATCVLARIYRLEDDIHNFFTCALKNVASDGCSEICYELGEYYYSKKQYDDAIIWYYNAKYETESILNIHYGDDLPLKALVKCYKKIGNEEKAKEFEDMLINC